MADFLARIFAIPSDVSSNYSPEPDNNGGGIGGNNNSRKKSSGHSRTLTPLSLTDGNGTLTSQSFGEGTLSYGTNTVDNDDGSNTRSGGGGEEEEQELLSSSQPTSMSSEMMEEHEDVGDKRTTRQYAPPPPRTATNNNKSSRGRQRRNDAPANRSASEQPSRRSDSKKYRSSSMMAAASSSRRTSNGSGGGGGGGATAINHTSRNMQLQLNSPSKNHPGSRRQSGKSLNKASYSKDPTLTRVNSWSSEDEESAERRRRQQRRREHRSRSSSAHQKTDRGNGGRSSSKQRMDNNHATAPTTPKKLTKKGKKDSSGGWRSKLGGMKKHLSPGTPSSTSAGTGTPPQHTKGGNKNIKGGGGNKTSKKNNNNSNNNNNNNSSNNQRPMGEARLNLPPSTGAGGTRRKQPINVGDSIFISQQFLEESAEMSVLTLPRELAALEKERANATGAVAEFDREVVGRQQKKQQQRSTKRMENYDHRGQGNQQQQHYHYHGAYASDRYSNQDSHSIVLDNGDDGIEVRPLAGLTTLEEDTVSPSGRRGVSSKHLWPCDPSAEGYSPRLSGGGGGGIPPPPPPPPPPMLPPRYFKATSPRSPQNKLSLPSPTGSSGGAAGIPHWNTPASSNSGSHLESIATSYDGDPPGMLVTSPTLQLHRSSLEDPPGDPYRPFDESASGLGGAAVAAPMAGAASQTGQNNRLRSNKAVSFSLPPPSSSATTLSVLAPPLAAPPFMGPSLDYYYSMERRQRNNTKNNNNAKQDSLLPCFSSSSSPLVPPIIELWSSIESSDNVHGSDIGGGNVAVASGGWDTKREDGLLGEDLPLHVSEEWIDDVVAVRDKKEGDQLAASPSSAPERNNADSCQKRSTAAVVVKKLSSTMTLSSWENEDTPHDEYFDDILHCGEEEEEDRRHRQEDNVRNDVNFVSHLLDPDSPEKVQQQRKYRDAMANHNDDDEDAKVRHRSTWNTAYKPPKLSFLDDDPSILQQHNNNDHDHDKWQRTVRIRTNAAITIQRSIRGVLQRERLHVLIDCALVIQPFIRRYLSKKRYLEYIRVKRSYYPNRWKRSNMAVAI